MMYEHVNSNSLGWITSNLLNPLRIIAIWWWENLYISSMFTSSLLSIVRLSLMFLDISKSMSASRYLWSVNSSFTWYWGFWGFGLSNIRSVSVSLLDNLVLLFSKLWCWLIFDFISLFFKWFAFCIVFSGLKSSLRDFTSS